MIDLQQMSVALNLATNRSLLIIDEFGKGTEAQGSWSAKGVRQAMLIWCRWRWACCWRFQPLAESWCRVPQSFSSDSLPWYCYNWINRGGNILMCQTEIFESGFLDVARPALAFGHLEVQVDVNALQIENQVTYLYT